MRSIPAPTPPQLATAAPAVRGANVQDPRDDRPTSLRPREGLLEGDSTPTPEPASAVGEEGDDAYLPRSLLTVPPRPIDFVNVPYPTLAGDQGHHVVRLWLFIDETGTVQRVTAEPGDAPTKLIEAARQAFLAARFDPGELDGQAVRSRIHVEVTFDESPAQR